MKTEMSRELNAKLEVEMLELQTIIATLKEKQQREAQTWFEERRELESKLFSVTRELEKEKESEKKTEQWVESAIHRSHPAHREVKNPHDTRLSKLYEKEKTTTQKLTNDLKEITAKYTEAESARQVAEANLKKTRKKLEKETELNAKLHSDLKKIHVNYQEEQKKAKEATRLEKELNTEHEKSRKISEALEQSKMMFMNEQEYRLTVTASQTKLTEELNAERDRTSQLGLQVEKLSTELKLKEAQIEELSNKLKRDMEDAGAEEKALMSKLGTLEVSVEKEQAEGRKAKAESEELKRRVIKLEESLQELDQVKSERLAFEEKIKLLEAMKADQASLLEKYNKHKVRNHKLLCCFFTGPKLWSGVAVVMLL